MAAALFSLLFTIPLFFHQPLLEALPDIALCDELGCYSASELQARNCKREYLTNPDTIEYAAAKALATSDTYCAQELLNLLPHNSRTALLRAATYVAASHCAKALAILNRASVPPQIEPYAALLKAKALFCAQNPRRAEAVLNRLVSDSTPPLVQKEAVLALAESAFLSDRYTLALKRATQADALLKRLERENLPRSSFARARVLYIQAASAYALGDQTKYLSAATRLLTEYPHTPAAIEFVKRTGKRRALGLLLEYVADDLTKLAALAEKIYRLGHADWVAYLIEIEISKRSIRPTALPEPLAELYARTLIRLQRYHEARALLEALSALSGSAEQTDTWLKLLAKVYSRTGLYRQAAQAYERLWLRHKDDDQGPSLLFLFAWHLGKAGAFEQAAQMMQLCEDDPQLPRRWRASARWYHAWFLYRAGKFARAAELFSQIGTLQAQYWLARTLDHLGQSFKAQEIYRAVANSNSGGYYQLLAWQRLKRSGKPLWPKWMPPQDAPLPPSTPWTFDEMLSSAETLLLRNAKLPSVEPLKTAAQDCELYQSLLRSALLAQSGLLVNARDEAELFFRELVKHRRRGRLQLPPSCVQPTQVFAKFDISALLMRIGAFGKLYRLAAGAYFRLPSSMRNRQTLLALPPFFAKEISDAAAAFGIPAAFISAVMLTESKFSPLAISRVGARGLMQLMPRTAKLCAEELELPQFDLGDLFSPQVNVMLGSWYLARLYEHYGRFALAAAAYNAGPHNVSLWLERAAGVPLDEFIESIPFRETRRYVKKVCALLLRYSLAYTGRPIFDDFTTPLPQPTGNPPAF